MQDTIEQRLDAIEKRAYEHGKTYVNRQEAARQARMMRRNMCTRLIQELLREKDKQIETLKAQLKTRENQQHLF